VIFDGHASDLKAAATTYGATQKLFLIRFVPLSSYFSLHFDLCLFDVFKIIYHKEKQANGLKGSMPKIIRALQAFYQGMIIFPSIGTFTSDIFGAKMLEFMSFIQSSDRSPWRR
jgi:hypothetical protein